jgi:peptidoglycan/LPS O-acetylase OafA/YrhL
VWYPLLVVGVPLAAYGFGRRLPAREAGALAAVGFGAGILLDYAYLGIAVLPIPIVVHRVVVVAAVGLLAAGAESGFRWTLSLRAGVVLW